MTYRYLHDLAGALRDAGCKVVELPGWRQRGRPGTTGNFDPRGVLVHHTGGASDGLKYAEWMALTGRSDLPAPLCQLALDRQGVVYVSAAGRANHAGAAKASGPIPAGDGNALYIGIEAMNTGTEGWTKTQREAFAKVCAALCAAYGWSASHVRGHKETSSTGKWDPGALDMDEFRARIAAILEGDDMPDRKTFQEWVRRTPISTLVGKDETPKDRPLEKVLEDLERTQEKMLKALARVESKLNEAVDPPEVSIPKVR